MVAKILQLKETKEDGHLKVARYKKRGADRGDEDTRERGDDGTIR
jgi:hypothetical protein